MTETKKTKGQGRKEYSRRRSEDKRGKVLEWKKINKN